MGNRMAAGIVVFVGMIGLGAGGCNRSEDAPADLASSGELGAMLDLSVGDLAASPDLAAPPDLAVGVDACGAPTCGWLMGEELPSCGNSGAMPAMGVTCDGDWCCSGSCAPGGHDQVCCNMKNGALRVCSYSGGACPCTEESCEPACGQ